MGTSPAPPHSVQGGMKEVGRRHLTHPSQRGIHKAPGTWNLHPAGVNRSQWGKWTLPGSPSLSLPPPPLPLPGQCQIKPDRKEDLTVLQGLLTQYQKVLNFNEEKKSLISKNGKVTNRIRKCNQ